MTDVLPRADTPLDKDPMPTEEEIERKKEKKRKKKEKKAKKDKRKRKTKDEPQEGDQAEEGSRPVRSLAEKRGEDGTAEQREIARIFAIMKEAIDMDKTNFANQKPAVQKLLYSKELAGDLKSISLQHNFL